MEYTIIRSKRKTFGIRVNEDLSVTVKAPFSANRSSIEQVLADNERWIGRQIEKIKLEKEKHKNEEEKRLTQAEIEDLAEKALEDIPKRVKYYSNILGVSYGRITIRNQKTCWGSCSGKGNLNFNCLLMLTPPDIRDYVVVHELCHRKEMNHSKAFWKEVENVLPDYRESRRWLKNEGSLIMKREF